MNRLLTLACCLGVAVADLPGGGHHGVHHGAHGAHHGPQHHGHHVAQPGSVHSSHQTNSHGVASTQSHGQVHHGTGSSFQTQHQVHATHPQHAVHHAPAVHHQVHAPQVHHNVHHAPIHHAAPVVVKQAPAQNIAELVVASPQFSTLLAAVQAAGLVDTLAGEGPFTVFAPTNSAFDKIPAETLNGLLADKEALTAVLLRHVVPGAALQGKNVPPGETPLETAGGETITADRGQFIKVKSAAGEAYVTAFDVIASNGVIHAIDTVI
jgi:uncharacterized surface protein with fasciclin (FAS1) repeats